MKRRSSSEQIEGMMKRPIPKKKVGIVRIQMVKEDRSLYGMRRFQDATAAAEMARVLFSMADREIFLVVSLDSKLEPMAAEIAAVGGVESCAVDMRSIFKHAILNNASYLICLHNHPSGDPAPSWEDRKITDRIAQAGQLLGIHLVDHIVVGEDRYFSFREESLLHGNGEYSAA